jgi:alpha-L-rhamnosidase
MENESLHGLAWSAALSLAVWPIWGQAISPRGPEELRVDTLQTPLGIDDPAPHFSWQLRDSTRGAHQSAYEVQVAATSSALAEDVVDVWDSGRVASSQSLSIRYQGPSLLPGKRYFWRVRLWDAAGDRYPESETSWWETGLMKQNGWQAAWIGYETREEAAVRSAKAEWIASPEAKTLEAEKQPEQHFDYRTATNLDGAVRSATLYATCQDTVSAWVDGVEVLKANPLPPYKQMPWKKYVGADVTKQLTGGVNSIAVECVHYVVNPNGMATEDAPPLNARFTLSTKTEETRPLPAERRGSQRSTRLRAGSKPISTMQLGRVPFRGDLSPDQMLRRSLIPGFRIP